MIYDVVAFPIIFIPLALGIAFLGSLGLIIFAIILLIRLNKRK